MTKQVAVIKPNVPSLTDLYNNVEMMKKQDDLNVLLSHQPKKEWIKKHPQIHNWYYLPIDKVEYLLKMIFKRYRIEIKKTEVIYNAVAMTVRVWYWDILNDCWEWHEGTGAQALQLNKGAEAGDMSQVKSGAVAMALPIAKTLAVKDACDHFGDLFGANLNRKDVLQMTPDTKLMSEAEKKAEIERLLDLGLGDDVTQANILKVVENEIVSQYNKAIKYLSKLEAKHGNQ
jgi:hypothetical protein